MTFVVIDYVFVLLLIMFTILGVMRGFIDNIFGKLSWIGGIIGAFFLYKTVSQNIFANIENKLLANILSFVILFIILFLIVKMVQIIVAKVFEISVLSSLDRALGFLFGIVEGIAVVFLIMFVLENQPFFQIGDISNGSFFFELLNKFLTSMEAGI